MTTELTYLTLVTLLTALMWIPYILNLITVRGLLDAVGYPDDPPPMAAWASRMKAAHYNAVENLVIFAVLVLVVQTSGSNSALTATACMLYFWTRLVHALCYTLAIPWVRTLAFAVGVLCQLSLAWELLI
ncbi:MAG: putative MAPEG superfamily protein [Halieaceae bacterium]|jgi:uncharacterized MAPEG superfamily protein